MLQELKIRVLQKGEIPPFLFVYSESKELFYEKFHRELQWWCREFSVDTHSIAVLSRDEAESHKIQYVKEFIERSYQSPRQAFQVFVFEDFWRLTVQSQNACLKFFEEPGLWNIIILTAPNLQSIVDTILSRIQVQYIWKYAPYVKNTFFESVIKEALSWNKETLIRYFFSKKYEREEYIDFLKTLLYVLVQFQSHIHLYEQLHDDIIGIESNNFLARNIVDRYILEL